MTVEFVSAGYPAGDTEPGSVPFVVPHPSTATSAEQRRLLTTVTSQGEYGTEQMMARCDGVPVGDESDSERKRRLTPAKKTRDSWHEFVVAGRDYRVVTGWMELLQRHVLAHPDEASKRTWEMFDEVSELYYSVAAPDGSGLS